MKCKLIWLLVFLISLSLGWQPVLAANEDELQNRIGRLEKELNDLKNELQKIKEEKAKEAEAKGKEKEAVVEKGKKGGIMVNGFEFIPFGFFKVDATYDTSETSHGNFVPWILQETDTPTDYKRQSRPNNDEFNLTANQTRFDLRIIAPEHAGVELSALTEIDFYGGTSPEHGAENKPLPLLRHAFIEGKSGTWGFLLGQTHDPISQQGPDTLDYFYRWDSGNIGYRRPQIRISKDWLFGDNKKVFTQAGVMRTVSDVFLTGSDKEDLLQKGGSDAGWPTTWARLGYSMPSLNKEFLIALSGHYGKEDVRFGNNDHQYFPSWSGNLEVVIPLPKGFSFKGEGFIGENMDAYLGGIGQGVNNTLRRAIKAAGGWIQIGWDVNPKLRFNAGYSVDNPKDSDLSDNDRSRNTSLWGNAYYNILPKLTIALEISRWRTGYKNGPDGDNVRTHLSTIYKF